MSDARHTKVLIIGSGPAGYTAGVYASRAMLNPILVQGMEPGGQLTTTTEVENWPGEKEIQGPQLMVNMEEHAKAMGCEIIMDLISDLDLSQRPFVAKGDRAPPTPPMRSSLRQALVQSGWVWSPKKPTRASACRPARPVTGSSTAVRKSL